MDVYIATSMRNKHEYININQTIAKIFSNDKLSRLNLRYFDPTQAYCTNRIDKGLSEALMLKRAYCTLYLVQESDTLGKDSELASTLAQGKPVIAYIPNDDEVKEYIDLIKESDEFKDYLSITIPKFLKENEVSRLKIEELKAKSVPHLCDFYNGRANALKDIHPLGIQVNLQTGVANGVLVSRSTQDCSNLIYGVLTNTLEFSIQEKEFSNNPYLELIESITGSVFRVVTGNQELTRAFWRFYLVDQ